ncbi:AraC family transcriptional regulator [Ruminococcaceae bacterium OttesenSCG-928-D13]|nr:AraC family transcriptional regulator [Ruminococcaceae bacterium OttesenSCG-928-D13]
MDAALLAQLSAVTAEEQALLDGGALDKAIYTSKGGFIIDRAQLLGQGRLIDIRPHTRFVDFPRHSHNYVEIIYMCAGETLHSVNDAPPLALRAGELLMLNQHASHAIRRAEAGDVGVNFLVLPEFFDYALELIGPDNMLGRFVAGSLQRGSSEITSLHFKVAEVLPVQNLVENLVWAVASGQGGGRRISKVTMGLLFLQLLNHADRMAAASEPQGGHALVMEVLREIEENYPTASLSALATRHGVSVAYFSQIIKTATGRTYKQLLQEKRLTRAASLLRGTRLSVGEVIAAVGYDNQSFFYRIFRERYGVSPKAYRADTGECE